MKALFITLSVLLHTTASQATGFSCQQILKGTPVPGAARYSVEVVILKKLPNVYHGKSYDSVTAVNVKVMRSHMRAYALVKNFNTVATSEDVVYEINAKKEGVKFGIFLDEMDQSYLYLKTDSGTKKMQLDCEYIEENKV